MRFDKTQVPIWGLAFVFLGVLIIILHLIGFAFKGFHWFDNWGPMIGWTIRLGIIVVGLIIFFLTREWNSQTSRK